MTLEDYRRFHAEEIGYAANVQSPALLAAFARVPRHLYHNVPVALDTRAT